ncbi:hypothetical protein D3C87_2096070 [compost metagenome]
MENNLDPASDIGVFRGIRLNGDNLRLKALAGMFRPGKLSQRAELQPGVEGFTCVECGQSRLACTQNIAGCGRSRP